MKTISSRIAGFKQRLLSLNDGEPLSGLSLAIIVALDIFVFSILMSGLGSHTAQLTSPEEYIPYVCRQTFIDHEWSPSDRITQLQNVALSGVYPYDAYRLEEEFDARRIAQMHPQAREFFEKVRGVRQDAELSRLFAERQSLAAELGTLNARFQSSKPAYDTALLERSVRQGSEPAAMPAVAGQVREGQAAIEAAVARLAALDRKIDGHPGVRDLWAVIAPEDGARRTTLIVDLRRFEFKYKVIELLWQMLFLLPVFAAFWFWNGRSLARKNRIQTLLSSHLLVVAAIPILFKAVELVVDLIPEHFFKELFKVLRAMHLIALWHFFLIAFTVAAALTAIYFVQKKVFSREQLRRNRLAAGQCHACGKRLASWAGAAHCPLCGTAQHTRCGGCGKDTPAAGDFCAHCGRASKADGR